MDKKLRIAIDATALPKKPVGAGRYIQNLVRETLSQNTAFEIVVFAHEDDFDLFYLDKKYKQNFYFVNDHGRVFRLIWEQLIFPMILIREKFDLVHGLHYSRPIIAPCPVVTTIHDMTFFVMPDKHIWVKRLFFRFFIRFSSRFSAKLLCVSENTKSDLIKIIGVDQVKTVVTPLGVDEQYVQISEINLLNRVKDKYALPDKFCLFVGLIEPRKNVPLLINAYAQAVVAMGDGSTNLVIAGRWGWESEQILRLVEELGLKERVYFPGYIDETDLPTLYSLAEFFVYPSFYEGFGLPVLESMACGTPVITTNISSMPEFVGDSGILVEPNDEIQLVNAIKKFLNHDFDKKSLAKEAKKRAARYTWENTGKLTLMAYEELLKNH